MLYNYIDNIWATLLLFFGTFIFKEENYEKNIKYHTCSFVGSKYDGRNVIQRIGFFIGYGQGAGKI